LQAVDLNAIVDSNVTNIQTSAESEEVTLTFVAQPDLPQAYSNELLLGGYVLWMILANAVTLTPKGGDVAIKTGTRGTDDRQWVGFTVSNIGVHILPHELPYAFEPYFCGEARNRDVTDTGLGLTIAKQMVDSLQGRIEIASSGIPGEGTTVSVWLPVAEADAGSEKPTSRSVDDLVARAMYTVYMVENQQQCLADVQAACPPTQGDAGPVASSQRASEMTDIDKTNEQLVKDMAALRVLVAVLERHLSKELFSNLAIELCHPLSNLKLYERLLRERGHQDQEWRDKCDAVLRYEIQRLGMMMGDVSELYEACWLLTFIPGWRIEQDRG